ncbi:ABC transporter permease [Leuconostoc carnosum]|uniref:ABC transporter permease n=1 Tax=Leuconostoc TaxID=1243 RepID=UPI000D51264D|nr:MULTISPECIES: ABC transporter permease [Leuconostoc]KAA8324508.1 ABC transporter permease [Leuconostoc carnosum]KAA8358181.1 ABC transporter permease [Leuconostoc carnosum]KAA8364679.1 ABC transporter permease [Leuconostoc carnosum]KAA8365552.1 ABC transporter permease [Leuconostoc carnosum]KAA8371581.1 ABC transporter permease [Leuconostoc carnosum]
MDTKIKKNRFGSKFMKNFSRELAKDNLALVATVLLVALFLFIVIGQFFVPKNIGTMSDILNANLSPLTNGHILGTTDSGADFLLTLIASSRNSIIIGVCVAVLITVISVVFGMIIGYFGGWLDWVAMRLIDFWLVMPIIMILAIIFSTAKGLSIWNLILILSVMNWPPNVRLIRTLTLSEVNRDYVEAAKISGTPWYKILLSGILPNISSTVISDFALTLAGSIGIETGLTFLGFGLKHGTSSLGSMLTVLSGSSASSVYTKWWLWVPVTLVLVIMTFGIVVLGQVARRAIDQRQSVS